MDYLRRATSYRAASRPPLQSRNGSINSNAEAGPSTPLIGTPRPGSPVDESVQYGSVAQLPSSGLARKMRRSHDSSSGESEERERGALHGSRQQEAERREGRVEMEVDKTLTRSRVYALIAVCTLSIGSHL